MDSTPSTDPPANGASLDPAHLALSSGATRAWRRTRRAAGFVLVVAALGVLLNTAGVLHVSGLLPRTGTAGSSVPNAGTATARTLALYPYTAAAPGPGCDQGAAVWTLMNATPAQNVVCAPTFTRLIAAPLGSSVSMSLRGAPLPARYTISLSVANISPCTSAIWQVATATQSGFALRLNAPAAATCGGGLDYILETTYPSGAGAERGTSYPVQTTSHTIVFRVDGAQVQLLLDGVLLDSFKDVAPPAWGDVQLGVSQTGGNAPASADFSNFAIM
jgi:hypothetical protein